MKKVNYFCDIEFAYQKYSSKKKLIEEAKSWIGPTMDEFDYKIEHSEVDKDVDKLHLHFKNASIGDLATFADNICATAKNSKKENFYPFPNLKITSIHIANSLGGIDLPLFFFSCPS